MRQLHTSLIALGANLPSRVGAPETTLSAAVERLTEYGRVVSRSSLYSTEPVGLTDQPRFLNAVVVLETALEPLELLHTMQAIELEFGRDRSAGIVNGPRTLDLDLLLYADRILDLPELQLPHPRLAERAFVLVPMAEAAAEAIDPRSGKSVAELLAALRLTDPKSLASVLRAEETW